MKLKKKKKPSFSVVALATSSPISFLLTEKKMDTILYAANCMQCILYIVCNMEQDLCESAK